MLSLSLPRYGDPGTVGYTVDRPAHVTGDVDCIGDPAGSFRPERLKGRHFFPIRSRAFVKHPRK